MQERLGSCIFISRRNNAKSMSQRNGGLDFTFFSACRHSFFQSGMYWGIGDAQFFFCLASISLETCWKRSYCVCRHVSQRRFFSQVSDHREYFCKEHGQSITHCIFWGRHFGDLTDQSGVFTVRHLVFTNYIFFSNVMIFFQGFYNSQGDIFDMDKSKCCIAKN